MPVILPIFYWLNRQLAVIERFCEKGVNLGSKTVCMQTVNTIFRTLAVILFLTVFLAACMPPRHRPRRPRHPRRPFTQIINDKSAEPFRFAKNSTFQQL